MDVSALSASTATVTRSSVTKTNAQTTRTIQPEAGLTILPSGDTVQISAEARSLSAQMSPSQPPPSVSSAQPSSQDDSNDLPVHTVALPLRPVSHKDTAASETTTAQATAGAVPQEDKVDISAEGSSAATRQTAQADTAQESSPLQRAQQQAEQQAAEEEQKAEEESKNKVESEITDVRRDITFLVGRAAINETAREELHDKKSELSELMVALFQLESVS